MSLSQTVLARTTDSTPSTGQSFGHLLKLGWGFPSLLVSLYSQRGQFYKEIKTYLKPLFFLTKAQVLFQDRGPKTSTSDDGIVQTPTCLESEASQQGVFAEKPAKSIAASSFPTHKITTWMVLMFRHFSGGSAAIIAFLYGQ